MEDGGGLPKHYHPIQEETWWWCTARFASTSTVPGGRFPEDGKVVVRPGIVHGLENRSGAEAHLREVRPPLDLQEFLTESAWAAREGLFMKGGILRSGAARSGLRRSSRSTRTRP